MTTTITAWRVACAIAAMPLTAFAQAPSDSAPARSSVRTIDIAPTLTKVETPSDGGYLGVSVQYLRVQRNIWWLGVQTGFLGRFPNASACDLAPGSTCPATRDAMLHVTPLLGVGMRTGFARLRAMAGPRLSSASSGVGIQFGGDLSLGSGRAAYYVPVTWVHTRHERRLMRLRTIGFGVQIR